MTIKQDGIKVSPIIDNLVIALVYVVAALVTTISVKDSSFPFYYALTTGLMAGFVIAKGIKALIGFFIGTIIWQVITIAISLSTLQLSIFNSTLFVLSEGLTLFIIAKSLQSLSDKNSLIEQNSGLVRFFSISLLAPLPQALAISYLLINSGLVDSGVTIFRLINLSWLSIAASIISISPMFISFSGIRNYKNLLSIKISWELTLFLLILIIPNALEILDITKPPYSFPIQYMVFPIIFIIAFRKGKKTLSFSILIFYLVTIYAASTSNGLFFSNNKFQNASNIYYFILFFLLMSLILSVAVNEKRMAFNSLKRSFSNAEEEVTRQINTFRELNSKLFQEIEQKGLIERELSESKDMIEESQTIASIASWQLDVEKDEISWSKSASKVFGIEYDKLPLNFDDYKKLIHPDDLSLVEETFRNALKSPTNFEFELRHLSSNKSVTFLLVRGKSFEHNGEINRLIGLLLDITKMKEIENQLLEKEEKYRALFESNIDSVSVINPEDKTFIDVNQTFEKRYGYSKDEIIGKPYSLITAEIDETYTAIEHAFRNGSHRVQSRMHKKKSGEEFYVEGIFVKFMLAGKPLIFVISQDITKRKIAEKALAEREMQFRLFFESDLIGMAEVTPQKEWITFNNKLCTILGYPAKELIQKTWDTITHPEDLKMEMKFYNELIVRKNSGYNIEKRFIRKDGAYIYCKVAVKAILSPSGTISHFVKLIEDISARKQIEKELLDSRATLRRAQQIAKLGSWSWNPSKNYISVNDEVYPLLGWKRSQSPFTIKNFIEIVSPEKKEIVEKLINDCIKEQKSMESIEVPIIKSNELRYILLSLGYNFGSSVNISEIVATMADITDIKKAEIALIEANSLKDQIFSIIAHDLRGPIGSINQMIAFIANDPNSLDTETRKDLLYSLKETSQETFNLLENLLDWARSQREVVFKPETINLRSSTDMVISLLSGMVSPKNITITNSIESDITAFADPYMLNTIFRNLLSNAIKFTSQNGSIKIEGQKDGNQTIIKFIDSGVGIPKKVIEKIFDNNSNGYSTLGTNNEKGTGLGLKLVRRLISQNNGSITLDSEQNIGTTFTITLPS